MTSFILLKEYILPTSILSGASAVVSGVSGRISRVAAPASLDSSSYSVKSSEETQIRRKGKEAEEGEEEDMRHSHNQGTVTSTIQYHSYVMMQYHKMPLVSCMILAIAI